MIEGMANGSSQFEQDRRGVEPKAQVASIVSLLHTANAQIGEPNRRRQCVEDGSDNAGHVPDIEQHNHRDKINKGWDSLDQLESRR